jgi:hypothetical protein
MKRVEVRLNLDAVAPLLDMMKSVADELQSRPTVELALPEPDEEIAAEWRRELVEGQTGDLGVLLGMFGVDFFSTGVIALDPVNAEPILRAAAAVRLKLRERHLAALEDDTLESGEIDLEAQSETVQRAFAAYVFLATLQEVIVQHLDPTVLE